jgi:Raf kinase inhibitor-like YbhB/YbcL family protein
MRPFALTAIPAMLLALSAQAANFTLQSEELQSGRFANEQVFSGFGCTGGNVSPHLKWSGAPAGTKSFVVTIYDPDAPTGSGWWHWVVANLPAGTSELAKGAGNSAGKLPAGAIQLKTDYGQPGYGGPCPPVGHPPHRYQITVNALKVEKLDLGPDATPALVGYMANANSLGKATLTATYGR